MTIDIPSTLGRTPFVKRPHVLPGKLDDPTRASMGSQTSAGVVERVDAVWLCMPDGPHEMFTSISSSEPDCARQRDITYLDLDVITGAAWKATLHSERATPSHVEHSAAHTRRRARSTTGETAGPDGDGGSAYSLRQTPNTNTKNTLQFDKRYCTKHKHTLVTSINRSSTCIHPHPAVLSKATNNPPTHPLTARARS
jgi:hypothetical protein